MKDDERTLVEEIKGHQEVFVRNRRERLMVKHRGIFKKKRGGTTSTWRSEEPHGTAV